jgi:hypothetical protein
LQDQIYQRDQEGKEDHHFQDPILQDGHTFHGEDHELQEPGNTSHQEKRGGWEYGDYEPLERDLHMAQERGKALEEQARDGEVDGKQARRKVREQDSKVMAPEEGKGYGEL